MTTISSGTGGPRSGVSAVPLHVLGFWVPNLRVFRYKHSPVSFLDCDCLFNRHCLIVLCPAQLQLSELSCFFQVSKEFSSSKKSVVMVSRDSWRTE